MNPNYGLDDSLNDDMAGVADALAREVIGFASAPVDEMVEILGSPVVKLFVMSNRPQCQVVVDLYDVNAEGKRSLITRGQFGTRTAEPGQHLTVEIEMRTIAYAVEAGHHLLLEVSNYDTMYAFPCFEPFAARLFHDVQHPSVVEVPVRCML
jgi:predicted acyl esterase